MGLREFYLVLISALLHASWNLLTKQSRKPMVFAVLLSGTTALGLLLTLPFFRLGDIPAAAWPSLAGSVVVHALYFYFLVEAYAAADLSLVYPICRSTPAFLPLLAIPLFGESLTPRACARGSDCERSLPPYGFGSVWLTARRGLRVG